jgi:signal peptidase I
MSNDEKKWPSAVFEVTDADAPEAQPPPVSQPPPNAKAPPNGNAPPGAKPRERPTLRQIEGEIARESGKYRFRRAIRSAAYAILVVAALAILVSTFFLPVMKVYGDSMKPTVRADEVVVCVKRRAYEPGDIIALYFNNRILLRRVIAVGGDSFNIDEDGNVFIPDQSLDEPYLSEKDLGPTDIELPFEVPEATYFVMGDRRATTLDSRSIAVGTVSKEMIAGKVLFSIWPPNTARSLTKTTPVSTEPAP